MWCNYMIRSARALGSRWLDRVEAYRRAKSREFFDNTKVDSDGCVIWQGSYSRDGRPVYTPAKGSVDRKILGSEVYIQEFLWYTYAGCDELAREIMVTMKGLRYDKQTCGKSGCIKLDHVVAPGYMHLLGSRQSDIDKENNPFNKAEIMNRLGHILGS